MAELLRLPEWDAATSAAALSADETAEGATAAQLVDPWVQSSSKLRELPSLVTEIAS